MAFTDDLKGLSRAEQIARVQAVAREHGDDLDESQAAQALSLYATLVTPSDSCLTAARTRDQGAHDRERAYVKRRLAQAAMEDPSMAGHAFRASEARLPDGMARSVATARRQWRSAERQACETQRGAADINLPRPRPDSPAAPAEPEERS